MKERARNWVLGLGLFAVLVSAPLAEARERTYKATDYYYDDDATAMINGVSVRVVQLSKEFVNHNLTIIAQIPYDYLQTVKPGCRDKLRLAAVNFGNNHKILRITGDSPANDGLIYDYDEENDHYTTIKTFKTISSCTLD